MEADEQRDVLGELEITARLMITGGEDKEEARMTRADRSLIRQCILDAAEHCVAEKRTVLTRDVRNALRTRGLVVAGWVANTLEAPLPHLDDNLSALQTVLAAPCWGHVPRLHPPTAAAVAAHLNPDAVPVRL